MAADRIVGVLLMAYGTPGSVDEVASYYTHIRRGRPPSPEHLADLRARYEALGGVSGFREVTEAQARGVQAALDAEHPGRYRVVLGLKHSAPFIEDAVDDLRRGGVGAAVALVLAPHYAQRSVGEYLARARAAAGDSLRLAAVESWHLAPGYIAFLSGAVTDAIGRLPPDVRSRGHVVFTAHSLPVAAVEAEPAGRRYPDRVAETAEAVAGRLALGRWSVGWQSAGATPEPWVGPDILEIIPDLAADPDVGALVVCACGFVSDHLEVRYDLDIEARTAAEAAGLAFTRTAMPNAAPAFTATLARIVLTHDPDPEQAGT